MRNTKLETIISKKVSGESKMIIGLSGLLQVYTSLKSAFLAKLLLFTEL